MWDKKLFEILFKTSLFTTYIEYIHMNYFLIFSFEILKFQIFFLSFSRLTRVTRDPTP